MTSTQQFIEDAIKGGWLYLGEHKPYVPDDLKAPGVAQFSVEGDINFLITMEQALLDRLAWQAVGKTRGWEEETYEVNMPPSTKNKRGAYTITAKRKKKQDMWVKHWHRVIDALADGKDIEAALQAIE